MIAQKKNNEVTGADIRHGEVPTLIDPANKVKWSKGENISAVRFVFLRNTCMRPGAII